MAVRAVTLALLLLAVAALWPFSTQLPFWPFTTRGRIFVESPEIYTRERLVNDRYEQDFWLKKQLEGLERATNLVSEQQRISLELWLGARPDDAAAPPPALLPTPFQDQFQLRAAMRDRIRQMLLENQLDDRHDLTGNSVYGLKFDTSVLPGQNTRRRAYVKVTVKTPRLPDNDVLPSLLGYSFVEIEQDTSNPFFGFTEHFNNWLSNIEWRLNTYLDDIPETPRAGALGEGWVCNPVDDGKARTASPASEDNALDFSPVTRTILAEALSKVLAIDARQIGFPELEKDEAGWSSRGGISLPEPWNRYFSVTIEVHRDCQNRPRFKVMRSFSPVTLIPGDVWDSTGWRDPNPTEEIARQKDEIYSKFFQIGYVDIPDSDGDVLRKVNRYYIFTRRIDASSGTYPTEREFQRISLKINFTHSIATALLNSRNGFDECIFRQKGLQDCQVTGKSYFIDAGLYNFASDILASDYYLYAVFPKTDVSGVLEQSIARVSGLDEAGEAFRGAGFDAESARSKSLLVPRQISFSEGEGENAIVFGWVIGSDGVQEAVQKSQFVLLSLPAYLRHLELEVETGWLNRDANFVPAVGKEPIMMSVALPPDYEAFDTLVSSGNRYGPAIFDRLMDPVTLEACQSATILIPGARLWRSASVTLGGQVAGQIIVLPNMRGIVARFASVASPPGAESGIPRAVSLQVWTSEGMDRIDDKVMVLPSTRGSCSSREDQGTTTP